MQLLVHVEALEQRQRLFGTVEELDSVGQRGRDRRDVVAHVLVQLRVVDDDAAVLAVELLTDDPHRHVRFAVEQRGRLAALGQRVDLLPLLEQPEHIALDLLRRDVLCAAVRTMTPCCFGFTLSRIERSRLRSSSDRRFEIP